MSESIAHIKLVKDLKKMVMDVIPSDNWCLIQEDTPESLNLPPLIEERFRPDIYYQFENLLVIGEAKTGYDVSRKHSRAQYDSYLRECAKFSGNAFLFLSVPWLEEAEASNIIRLLKKKHPGEYSTRICAWIDGGK